MSLGSSIAKSRKNKGLTQTALAEQLGVHQSHITRWESDRVRPREKTLAQIATALQVTPEELMIGGQDALASSFNLEDPELVDLLVDIPRLQEEEIGALKVLLRGLMARVRMKQALQ